MIILNEIKSIIDFKNSYSKKCIPKTFYFYSILLAVICNVFYKNMVFNDGFTIFFHWLSALLTFSICGINFFNDKWCSSAHYSKQIKYIILFVSLIIVIPLCLLPVTSISLIFKKLRMQMILKYLLRIIIIFNIAICIAVLFMNYSYFFINKFESLKTDISVVLFSIFIFCLIFRFGIAFSFSNKIPWINDEKDKEILKAEKKMLMKNINLIISMFLCLMTLIINCFNLENLLKIYADAFNCALLLYFAFITVYNDWENCKSE